MQMLAKCIFLPTILPAFLPTEWVIIKSMRSLNLQLNNRGRLQCATSAIVRFLEFFHYAGTTWELRKGYRRVGLCRIQLTSVGSGVSRYSFPHGCVGLGSPPGWRGVLV